MTQRLNMAARFNVRENRNETITSVAESKLAYLRERGYRQCAVVMVGPDGCCTVSNLAHVQWFGATTEMQITGASMTESALGAAPAVPPNARVVRREPRER